MDSVNAQLWSKISGAPAVAAIVGAAAKSKGVWNMRARPGTPLPLLKFRLVTPARDYTFGGLSCLRLVYQVTACAEDEDGGRAGSEVASLLAEAALAAANDAELTVAGYELLLCRSHAGLPPDVVDTGGGREEHTAGFLLDILLTPA